MNWDDLRVVLAVAREGTLVGGARALKVNPSTISRRLRAVEERLDVALFEKLKHGVVLTRAGEELVATARQIEQLTHDLDARIRGLDARLEGTIRVTSTDMLLKHWLADFGTFRQRHPGITLEVTSTASLANLTWREADVAVRIAPSAPEHLIGTRHAELGFAIYGSAALVDAVGPDAPYAAYPWVGYDLAVFRIIDRWLAQHAPGATIALRVGGISTMFDALEAGLGLAILPCIAGDSNPRLRRVGSWRDGGSYLWVLTHPELRGTARIRAFTTFMRELIERDRALLVGAATPASSR